MTYTVSSGTLNPTQLNSPWYACSDGNGVSFLATLLSLVSRIHRVYFADLTLTQPASLSNNDSHVKSIVVWLVKYTAAYIFA